MISRISKEIDQNANVSSQRQGGSSQENTKQEYCFYLDVKDPATNRKFIKRIHELGLRRELVLTERVTHVVSASWSGGVGAERLRRADAMLARVCGNSLTSHVPTPSHVTIDIQQAFFLLDKIYKSTHKAVPSVNIKKLKAPYIKFEPFSGLWRPIFKEFDVWPDLAPEPNLPTKARTATTASNGSFDTKIIDIMTRKHRQRKEETKESKSGYCEMCNTDYANIMVHRRSPQHLAFVRDSNNFRALDEFITSGADVSALLDKGSPLNGERRSLRKLCNGDAEPAHSEATVNGAHIPRFNGLHDTRKRRCTKSADSAQGSQEDQQYYKVVTKLRSSGSFATPKQESASPTCNGNTKGLVVKFRQVRRSELSVLSDEAEQFMFPRRQSSSSSEDEEEDKKPTVSGGRRSAQSRDDAHDQSVSSERRRSARPTALKEESSDDEHVPPGKRRKRSSQKKSRLSSLAPTLKLEITEDIQPEESLEIATSQDEVKERCLKWEDGRLKATPVVEELRFAFESVPTSEPWYESFERQDQHKPMSKNVTQVFASYSTISPKLPYELGQLPPLKPNCCPLSDLMKKDDKGPGPSRSYGTRGNKKQKMRKRMFETLLDLEQHPRKSPREHASTLAILGGLLHRRKNQDDTKSTASEETCSDANSNAKCEVTHQSEPQEQSERLNQFLSEVFEDDTEYEVPEDVMNGEAMLETKAHPDVVKLVSECEECDIIRNEVKECPAAEPAPARRGHRFKKKNRTGWPKRKKTTAARSASLDACKSESSAADTEDVTESTVDSASELDESTAASTEETSVRSERASRGDRRGNCTESSAEEVGSEAGWGMMLLQPVVRVSKLEETIGRRTRSAAARVIGPRARRARPYCFR